MSSTNNKPWVDFLVFLYSSSSSISCKRHEKLIFNQTIEKRNVELEPVHKLIPTLSTLPITLNPTKPYIAEVEAFINCFKSSTFVLFNVTYG